MATDTQVALVQLVALTIPTIGIYMHLFARHAQVPRPLEHDTFYSAKLAALAFIGAALLLVSIMVGGSSYLSNTISLVLSGIAVFLIIVGFLLFGESVWSLTE